MAVEDIAKIEFGNPALNNVADWEHHKAITRKLCELGTVTEWINNPTNGYPSLPYRFSIEGVAVEFMPHWGFIKMNGISVTIPASTDAILPQIKAIITIDKFIIKPR